MTTVYAAPPETATEPLVDRVGYRRDTFEFVWDGGKYIDAYLAGEADPFLSITATYPDGTHRDATPGRLRAVVDRYIDALGDHWGDYLVEHARDRYRRR